MALKSEVKKELQRIKQLMRQKGDTEALILLADEIVKLRDALEGAEAGAQAYSTICKRDGMP